MTTNRSSIARRRMRRFRTLWLVPCILAAITTAAHAQMPEASVPTPSDSSEQIDRVWLEVGIGGTSGTNESLQGACIPIAISATSGNHYATLRYTAGGIGIDKFTSFQETAALVGVVGGNDFINGTIAGGVAYISTTAGGPTHPSGPIISDGVGLALEARGSVNLWVVGIGLKTNAAVTSEGIYYGAALTASIGKFWTTDIEHR